jgi:geranylgeranyl pyrophosphate synthase
MAAVEARLAELTADRGELLSAEAAATLAAGGKRLRPMLVLVCSGSAPDVGAVRAATAVELVHMATLVHDDVLDAAPLRRGQPTVLARAGRDTATAVGDLLLSRAFAELAGEGPDGIGQARAGEQVALLADAAVALARGELAQRRDAFDTTITAERYLDRCRLKTGRLFECACVIGTAGGEQAPAAALRAFGAEIGLAFQLLDDVLDVTGPPGRTGKARGTDLLDGTVTLPLILARERDPALGPLELRGLDPAAAEALCDRIDATGVLDQVRVDATARVERAKAALERAPLDGERRALLELVADGVVDRYS